MKILFVENRYKTYFWLELARALIKLGHTVQFIVQNHAFAIKNIHCSVIAYPSKADLIDCADQFDFIKNSDRNITYFSGDADHYCYYYQQIASVVKAFKPDLVVGESTLFHELLTVQICREEKILYLNPSSSSYPKGRFSLYQWDKKLAYRGSDEVVSDQWCDELIEDISQRKIKPDYMLKLDKRSKQAHCYPKPGSWQDRWTIIQAYFKGERYNTPHPWRKFSQDRKLHHLKARWDALAQQRVQRLADKKIVLYPLQMQPEANLDVWGQTYRDQAELVDQLVKVLPHDCCLVVKANPKVKYELNEKLLSVLEQHPTIIPLALRETMEAIFSRAYLIVTVTGTIAIEAVLSNKPLISLGESVVRGSAGVCFPNHLKESSSLFDVLATGGFSMASQADKRALIRRLLSSSYSGLISDPCHAPECLDAENIKKIALTVPNALGDG